MREYFERNLDGITLFIICYAISEDTVDTKHNT